jgi:hypothetical protein
MILRCPKCKSDDVITISRRKYLLRASACLAAIAVWYIVFRSLLKDENDVSIGLIISTIPGISIFAVCVYLVIKAIRTKKTTYYCGYCECNVDAPLKIERSKEFDTMAQIRRQD